MQKETRGSYQLLLVLLCVVRVGRGRRSREGDKLGWRGSGTGELERGGERKRKGKYLSIKKQRQISRRWVRTYSLISYPSFRVSQVSIEFGAPYVGPEMTALAVLGGDEARLSERGVGVRVGVCTSMSDKRRPISSCDDTKKDKDEYEREMKEGTGRDPDRHTTDSAESERTSYYSTRLEAVQSKQLCQSNSNVIVLSQALGCPPKQPNIIKTISLASLNPNTAHAMLTSNSKNRESKTRDRSQVSPLVDGVGR